MADSQLNLQDIAEQLREGVEVKDRRYHMKTYAKCFTGSDAVAFMMSSGMVVNLEDAVQLGNALLEAGHLAHVVRDHSFKNEGLFYRFSQDEDHGTNATTSHGSAVSWRHFLPETLQSSDQSMPVHRPDSGQDDDVTECPSSTVRPMDEHNVSLLDKVHPAQWIDPSAKPLYDLVVIGAGAGGLVSAASASGLGARVALIEEHLMGGDCLNVGCVPSKGLIKAARVAHELRKAQQDASDIGVSMSGEINIDFAKIMTRIRRVRAEIADNDSVERFAHKLGVDVFLGTGSFLSKNTVQVNGKELKFVRCIVAAGGSPRLPAIPGLAEAYKTQDFDEPRILTNENVFNLTSLPKRLGVIGAGPIGLELAQSFQRLGAQVTVFARSGKIMPKEEQAAADIVRETLTKEGVVFCLDIEQYASVQVADNTVTMSATAKSSGSDVKQFEFDALLVAAGRQPNVSKLNLDAAGIGFDTKRGVHVNDRLQTSNDAVYAVGDVCTHLQFTHAADFMARMVVRNALFFGKDKFSSLLIPWCTYTSPEVGHVGASAQDLEADGVEFDVYEKKMEVNDRAILEDETDGFVRVLCKKGSDKIIGATIVAANAGDMISELTLAIQSGTGLSKLASVIHPYPTQADAIRGLGDIYNRTRLTLTVKMLLRKVIKLHSIGRN